LEWLKIPDSRHEHGQEEILHIDQKHPEINVHRQCELIELPRSSYYQQPAKQPETAENLLLIRLIDEEYTRHPFYGSRKMCDHLRRQRYEVNRKRIQRLMRVMGIQSIAPQTEYQQGAS